MRVLSVCVGLPQLVQTSEEGFVTTAIFKKPVEGRVRVAELNLEGTGGLQLLRTIRADDRLKKCPFNLMAKSLTAAEAVAIKNAGADGLLLKQFRGDALITKIDGAVRARPKARRLPEPSIKKSFAAEALRRRF